MTLTKKDRQIVWNKSDGICWYCGCDLPEKGWHADHFEPIRRITHFEYRKVDGLQRYVATRKGAWREDLDVLSNIVPSCAPCNLFKHDFTLEQLRTEIADQIRRGRAYSANFRAAERYGCISVHEEKPVVFWFEQRNSHDHS